MCFLLNLSDISAKWKADSGYEDGKIAVKR